MAISDPFVQLLLLVAIRGVSSPPLTSKPILLYFMWCMWCWLCGQGPAVVPGEGLILGAPGCRCASIPKPLGVFEAGRMKAGAGVRRSRRAVRDHACAAAASRSSQRGFSVPTSPACGRARSQFKLTLEHCRHCLHFFFSVRFCKTFI